jgi:putative SOS response-associated peptidase YedK
VHADHDRGQRIVGQIHDRMPVILMPDDHERWLDPAEQPVDRLKSLLGPLGDDFW